MTIYRICSEVEDFDNVYGSVANSYPWQNMHPGFTRCYVYATEGILYTYLPGLPDDFWLTATVASSQFQFSNKRFLMLTEGGYANQRIGLRSTGNGTVGFIQLIKLDGGIETQLAIGSTQGLPAGGTAVKFDIHITNYSTGNCTIEVYQKNLSSGIQTREINYNGDPRPLGSTSLDGVVQGGSLDPPWTNPVVGAFAELIVADVPTTRMAVVTLTPDADDVNTMTSGTYASVNVVQDTYASYVAANSLYEPNPPNDRRRILMNANSMPAGSFAIRAMQINATVTSDDLINLERVNLGLKSGGTEDWDNVNDLTLNWVTYRRLLQQNPITAADFTQAEIDAIAFGIRPDHEPPA